ncbi:ATP-dependent nuclease [Beijerinckia mobilis]|uniref:ATP-dependent nuclease n=1 Tax=Beijerinckia mobilis TaxID=231434 RepID=UPI000551CDF4|nr:AAA family ATPase [Beijerinckia mobilis]
MPGTIHIKNLRNIKQLDFNLPGPGVWLLTAGNGAGKTSLLACLRRIGNSQAFSLHFPASLKSKVLDDYGQASITYEIEGATVEYAYRGARWTPQPRRNSHLLSNFGYPDIIYIGANADRITPRPDDFAPRRVKKANADLIKIANEIFDTNKFNELKVINLTTGVSNEAFMLQVNHQPDQYHSEKQFSLGELCILKLIKSLQACQHNSLVLIDELEMALHPRAQIQLYKYLVYIAKDKELTIIFSTHSVSLIKGVPRKQIIFLQRDDNGIVNSITGCFPTYALGNITLGEERAPDVVLYVEDEIAKAITEPLIKLVMQKKFSDQNLFPVVQIIPIGGFHQVIQFLSRHNTILPSETKCFALLDKDVKDETIPRLTKDRDHKLLEKINSLGSKIAYLPWTPEEGIISYLCDERNNAQVALRSHFCDNRIVLPQHFLQELIGLVGEKLRSTSKKIFKDVCRDIASVTGKSLEQTERDLCTFFAKEYFNKNENDIMQLLAPKLS